jgi:methylenetetrahydrofolate dehydrogenase (NADP+)/methenyltetrahydrofolate cyclohydrolase
LALNEVQDSQSVDISEDDLLAIIDKYNNDDSINGILVQLPLPDHINEKKVLNAIDPDKDVDGFHPVNVGRLMIGGDEVKFPPCTPAGIQEMIVRAGVETSGAEVVVVGRSNIVGKPIANMMLQKGKGANSNSHNCSHTHKEYGRTLQTCGHLNSCRRCSRPGKTGVD